MYYINTVSAANMELSLRTVYNELTEIKALIERSQNQSVERISPSEREILLRLNGSQIKTYLIMDFEKEYTADDVASITGNARAHESSILNELTRLNLLEKRRHSKTVYFRKTP